MIGHYITGMNQAHKCCSPHRKLFGCEICGTFNVYVPELRILEKVPSITTEKANYYFLELQKGKNKYYGWAVRDHTSHQRGNVLEIVTKGLLPDSLKSGEIEVTILEKWDSRQIRDWAKHQYWFQGFSFSPIKKADSNFLWDKINIVEWSNRSVLDIGCHYGFFSFKASEAGAKVVGFDTNNKSLGMGRIIRDSIIHQDVTFVNRDPKTNVDIILYLSVHHQPDPTYKSLKTKINELKCRTKEHLFVELIMPPLFPKGNRMSEVDIDKIVGGVVLATYRHNVRGVRRVYQCKGTCK
jgi:hypothetical protein